MLERSARCDPLRWLAGHRSNAVEILVVVMNREIGSLGHGGDEEIGKAGRAVLTALREASHHVGGAIKIALRHGDVGERLLAEATGLDEIGMAARAEIDF